MADQERKDKVEKIVADLQEYVKTYSNGVYYKSYTDETIIDDILYGLGIALDREQYEMHSGYQKFKRRIAKHIETTTHLETVEERK